MRIFFLLFLTLGCHKTEKNTVGAATGNQVISESCTSSAQETRIMYQSSDVNGSCVSESQTRSCVSGKFSDWSGTFKNVSCYEHRVMYQNSSSLTCPSQDQKRVCSNNICGTWDGTYAFSSCNILASSPGTCPTSKCLYVSSAGSGSKNGSDWSNSWNGIGAITWANVTAGTTIFFSGGTYSQSLVIGSNGTSSSRIYLKRATSANHGTNTGWQSSYDSQVILNSTNPVVFSGKGNYTTIDGVVDSGIKIIVPNGGAGIEFTSGNSESLELKYLDIVGPGKSVAHNDDTRAIDATAYAGNDVYYSVNNFLLSHSKLHGEVTIMWLNTVTNSVFEYNQFYESGASNTSTPASNGFIAHPNVIVTQNSSNIKFRYNEIFDWMCEGIMFKWEIGGDWFIYGNLWHDATPGETGRIIEANDSGITGIQVYLYNNTFANIPHDGIGIENGGGGWNAQSEAYNNIFWNVGGNSLTTMSAFHSGNNLITSNSNVFVNVSSKDYHLKVGSPAINAGTSLNSQYALDFDGSLHGYDGGWDLGALEYKP